MPTPDTDAHSQSLPETTPCHHNPRSWSRRGGLLAALIVCIIVLLRHAHNLAYISTHIIGGAQGDSGLYVWLAASFHHNPQQALQLETSALYPYPLTRGWSDSFLLPSLCVSLLMKAGASLTLAYNLTIVCSLLLNGLAVLALCTALKLSRTTAVISACTFACCAYLGGNQGHPQLQLFFWVPLAWACVLHPRRTQWGWWLSAGLCVSAAFYSAVYYSIFALLGLVCILALKTEYTESGIATGLKRALALALGSAPIALVIPAYQAVKSTFGDRGLYEADAFRATGLSYLALPSYSWLYGYSATWTHPEATLGSGYVALTLAALYLFREARRIDRPIAAGLTVAAALLMICSSIVDAGTTSEWLAGLAAWTVILLGAELLYRRSSPAAHLGLVMLLFFTLSFGPGGNPEKGEPAFAPFTVLYSFFPGFDALRAVSRCGVVALLGVCISAAHAIHTFTARISAPLVRKLLCGALCALILVENYTPGTPLDPIPARPQAFDYLTRVAAPDEAAIALPFAGELTESGGVKHWSESAVLGARYALWGVDLPTPLVNGYSGQRSKLSNELPAALRNFPSLRAHEWLARICGLRWIVVVPELIPSWNQSSFEQQLRELSDLFIPVAQLPDGSMLLKIEPWVTTTRPFFAPRNRTLALDFKDLSDQQCFASINDAVPGPQGSSEFSLLLRYQLDATHLHIDLEQPHSDRANTFVFTVETALPCTARVRCSLQPAPGGTSTPQVPELLL